MPCRSDLTAVRTECGKCWHSTCGNWELPRNYGRSPCGRAMRRAARYGKHVSFTLYQNYAVQREVVAALMFRYNDFGLVMTVANFGISKEVPAWLTPRVNVIKGLTNMAHYRGVPWRCWPIPVQGPKKWFAKCDKHYPSRFRQISLATAVTNFTKPRTSHFFGLCTLFVLDVTFSVH